MCFAPASATEKDSSSCRAAIELVAMGWVEPEEAIEEARPAEWRVFGLSLTPESVRLQAVEWKHPAAMLLGRELEGLASDLAAKCHVLLGIPRYGLVTSLKVAASCAVAVSS